MTARHVAVTSSTSARAFALGSAVALAALSVPGVAYAAKGDNKGNKNDKQTICHATNSNTNPYVVNTPNKNGDVDGHAKHTGPIWDAGLKAQHVSWGDIIPPFDYNDHGTSAHYAGQNWTADGQAWFANGCAAPTGGGSTGGTTGTSTGGTTGTSTGGTTGTSTGGATGGGTGGGGGGGGTFTGGGGGTFTGGGGGTTVTPTTLPRTGFELADQAAYGGALVLAGVGALLLVPRRRATALT